MLAPGRTARISRAPNSAAHWRVEPVVDRAEDAGPLAGCPGNQPAHLCPLPGVDRDLPRQRQRAGGRQLLSLRAVATRCSSSPRTTRPRPRCGSWVGARAGGHLSLRPTTPQRRWADRALQTTIDTSGETGSARGSLLLGALPHAGVVDFALKTRSPALLDSGALP